MSPAYPGLATRIRTGPERMLADGSFDQLFNKYHAEHLQRAQLDQRLWLESIVQEQRRPTNEVHSPAAVDWFSTASQQQRGFDFGAPLLLAD